ncbi:Ran GTPase-activating protein [Nosema bombycis CQ1]|uniref:Ran GTPase-activating protein n=1 Tax=Nosema bombycis (strain CQ1 / CVCC 102059) TaxID=578461 RepID=R0MBL0_NOSB1|nr:Ran GTPase-activating protein [Nosema bombycis CQ1]|eukprot:EOB11395.1 Ran GTPase-activating protein [Nosema bombycis CQ1]
MLFSLKNQEKKYIDKSDTESIVKDLMINPEKITELDLTSNVFKPKAFEGICECIEKMKNLKFVVLDEIFTTLVKEDMLSCFVMVSKALMNKNLEVLDLSNNALSSDLPNEFLDLLSSLDSLKVLKVRNCGLGLMGADKLGECFTRLKKGNLEYLDLAQNRFFKFPQILAIGLSTLKNLRVLHLEFNTIEKDSMSSFLPLLLDKPLEILDIRDNFLNLKGCQTLGEMFCVMDLKELMIGDCLMHDEGVKAFLKEASTRPVTLGLPGDIEVNVNCELLDLSYNDFEQESLNLLVDFVEKYQIRKLLINGNYFEETDKLKTTMEKYGGVLVEEDEYKEEEIIKEEIDENLLGMVSNL